MAEKLVMLNDKDYKKVIRRLKNRKSALIATRRILVNEADDTPKEILVGDTLVLCAMFGTKPTKTVHAIESNRAPHDPAPAFIKCVPA